MENAKSNLPKIVIGTAVGALTLFFLYKIMNRGKGSSTANGAGRISKDEFAEIIDQRSPIDVKQKEAHDFVVSYIKKHISGRVLKLTPDGRFQSDDFALLQRIMNFYAQATSFDVKIRNQEDRVDLLQSNQFEEYVDTMRNQQGKEVDAYNEALSLICETAKIQQETFMKTYGNETGGKDLIVTELINQCLSPFKSLRGFTKDQTIEMFANVASLTIEKLKEIDQKFPDTEQFDYVIFFDKLMTDFAYIHHGVNAIEFWASVCKYDLLHEPLDSRVQVVFNQYSEIMAKYFK